MKEFQKTPRPTNSRWGRVQTAIEIANGIWSVSTAGHGGFIVSRERLAAMPEWMRRTAYSADGEFEEDSDWCLPVIAFAEEFAAISAPHFEEGSTWLTYAKDCYDGAVKRGYYNPPDIQPDGFDVNLLSRFD